MHSLTTMGTGEFQSSLKLSSELPNTFLFISFFKVVFFFQLIFYEVKFFSVRKFFCKIFTLQKIVIISLPNLKKSRTDLDILEIFEKKISLVRWFFYQDFIFC